MIVGPVEQSQRAPRKNGRSTSPRAVELRRLQNRLSQRKHRSKVRQARNNFEGDSALTLRSSPKPPDSPEPVATLLSSTAASNTAIMIPTTTSSQFPAELIMADDFLQSEASWQSTDSLYNLPESVESRSTTTSCTSSSYPYMTNAASSKCATCNSTNGPCSHHFEIPQAQLMTELNTSPPTELNASPPLQELFSLMPLQPIPPLTTRPQGCSNVAIGDVSMNLTKPDQESLPTDVPLLLTSELNESTTAASASAKERTVQTSCNPSTGNLTHRFEAVMNAVRQAGFQNVEEMVVAYYTSQFEWGSVPAMMQGLSRSCRLKYMLQELLRKSAQWPKWKSRGLNESVVEAAVSLCIDEMEHQTVSQNTADSPSQTTTAKRISALEWLLNDQGCSLDTAPDLVCVCPGGQGPF